MYDESVDRGMRIQAMLKSSGAADLPPLEEEGVTDAEGAEAEAVGAEGEDAEGVDSEEE